MSALEEVFYENENETAIRRRAANCG